jgi:alkane 1-monooxygenase
MKPVSYLKYLSVLSLPVLVAVSFTTTGWTVWLPVLEVFVLIPFVELFFKPDPKNIDGAAEKVVEKDKKFDFIIYAVVPIQFCFLIFFFFSVSEPGLGSNVLLGRIVAMGLMCGVLGINVAHELGHRKTKFEQLLSKTLLSTSLYMHI